MRPGELHWRMISFLAALELFYSKFPVWSLRCHSCISPNWKELTYSFSQILFVQLVIITTFTWSTRLLFYSLNEIFTVPRWEQQVWGIIGDPPSMPRALFSLSLSCRPLFQACWRGAEKQDNYDIMAGWLSSSPSWWETEGRNGQPESNCSHRKAIHHMERLCSSFVGDDGCLTRAVMIWSNSAQDSNADELVLCVWVFFFLYSQPLTITYTNKYQARCQHSSSGLILSTYIFAVNGWHLLNSYLLTDD